MLKMDTVRKTKTMAEIEACVNLTKGGWTLDRVQRGSLNPSTSQMKLGAENSVVRDLPLRGDFSTVAIITTNYKRLTLSLPKNLPTAGTISFPE